MWTRLIPNWATRWNALRLRRVFEQKLDSEMGYVLPIKAIEGADQAGPHWRTGPWFVRDERLYLMPGRLAHGPAPAAGFACLGSARPIFPT